MNTSGHDPAAGQHLASTAPEWSLGRLLSMAARLVEQDWNNWLARRGMTHAGLLALHVLETGPHTQRELAAAGMVEEQTMSRVLDRLERAGHVTRQRDPADRRRLIVRSTTAGQQAYRAAIDADVANTIITDRLGEPEAFRRLLIQLIISLLAARGEPAPPACSQNPPAGTPTTEARAHRQRAAGLVPLHRARRQLHRTRLPPGRTRG